MLRLLGAASMVALLGACQAPSQTVDQAAVAAAVDQTWGDFERAWESGDLEAALELYT